MVKVYKQFNGELITEEWSDKTWELLTFDEDGSKNGWFEVEGKTAPTPPKEVEIAIEQRTINTNDVEPTLDVDSMKRQELMAWLKENSVKFDAKQKNVELKEIIKNAISTE